jgi:glycerophosphodiester phosphodiesterase
MKRKRYIPKYNALLIMKNLWLILAVGFAAFSCSGAPLAQEPTRVDSILRKLYDPNTSSVVVVAHRGDWKHSVENSLPAVQHAIEMGVDVVEIDIRRTADGRLVLMHDATIDRTTNGRGEVASLTFDSIRRCRLKAPDGTLTDLLVPTLDEVFELGRDRILFNIDKGFDIFDDVFFLADSLGVARQVLMKGTQPTDRVQEALGKYLDRIVYMPIVHLDKEGALEAIADFQETIRPAAYELLYGNDTTRVPLEAEKMLAGRALIWYNTMWKGMAGSRYDDRAETEPDSVYGVLIDSLGARIIQTDRPGPLIRYLEARGQH